MCLICQDLLGVLNTADTPDELTEICQLFCTLKFQIPNVPALENQISGNRGVGGRDKQRNLVFREAAAQWLVRFGGIFTQHLEGEQIWVGLDVGMGR